jgi:hypothetical protein
MINFPVTTSISILIMAVLLTGCFNFNNDEDRKREAKEAETKCSNTEIFNNVIFHFSGFEDQDFDTVTVKEYKDTLLLNTFNLFVGPALGSYDQQRKVRLVAIKQDMNIKNRYLFIVPGKNPYELSNMEIKAWGAYGPDYVEWHCMMVNYILDGVRYEGKPNVTFTKNDSTITK